MPEIHFWQGRWNGSAPDGGEASRAREIVRYTGGIVRGKFPSRKMRRMVHHEGLLELDAVYLFETSPLITSYREQPVTISYLDGDKRRRYTPDFEVMTQDGELIYVEVKPRARLEREDVAAKMRAVSSHFELEGQSFLVLDDRELRQMPRLESAKTIWRRLPRLIASKDHYRHGLRAVIEGETLPLAELEARLKPRGLDPYGALLYGLLHFDSAAPLLPITPIHIAKESDHAWFCLAPRYGL